MEYPAKYKKIILELEQSIFWGYGGCWLIFLRFLVL